MKWSAKADTVIRFFCGLLWLLLPLAVLAQDEPATTHIRLGHFSLDAGAIDIYVDGTLYAENVRIGTLFDWRVFPAGKHTLTMTRAGNPVENPLLIPAELDFPAEAWQTLALIGRRTDGTLRLHRLTEDYSPLQPGETRLSIFHALVNNPPLNIQANATEIIRLLGYPGTLRGDSDGLATVNIIPNRYDLAFTLDDGSVLLNIQGINLGVGQHYFIALTGSLENVMPVIASTDPQAPETDTPVTATAADTRATPTAPLLTPTAVVTAAAPTEANMPTETAIAPPSDGQVRLRIGHFVPGASDFDIYLDDALLTDAIYPTLTPYFVVAAGDHTLAVVIEGETLAEAILTESLVLAANSVVTVMAIGSLDTGTFALQPIEEDYSPADRLETRLAVFNAIPDAQFINIIADNALVLVQGLSFPNSFAGAGDGFISLDMVAGVYQLTVETNGVPLLSLSEIRMGEGRYYFLVAAGTTNTAFFVLESVNIAAMQP
jgi:hypothetical protein